MNDRDVVDSLPPVALGGAALGGLYEHVDDDQAVDVVRQALARGLTYVDTAPLYGSGVSETRIGRALHGFDRSAYVLSTKVGRLLERGGRDAAASDMFADAPPASIVRDYSGDGVRRSLEASLVRLGTDRVDIVYVHDPEDHMDQAVNEAMPALTRMRDEGVVGAVGVGTNRADVPARFLRECDVDVVLLAGRWTLLDRSGRQALDDCADRGVPVVLGGIMNSGLLADPGRNHTFDYLPARPEVEAAARAMHSACRRRGVALGTAAVLHAFRHGAVRSVLVGCRSANEVDAAADIQRVAVGEAAREELWEELDRTAAQLGLGVAT